jgi:hypothetical protein
MKNPARCVAPALIVLLSLISSVSRAEEISAAGRRLEAALDSLDVEHHWPAGVHVHWETGEPDGQPESAVGKHTHCSAFVAAAAKHLGIYILRPPEHKQLLLANAQYEWLQNEGRNQGWTIVDGPIAAQLEANRGRLVLATYRNHNDDKPGHIAIVRPSLKDRSAILSRGPQITQAGGTNHRSTDLATGFASHPAAWGRHEVRFYSHAVE